MIDPEKIVSWNASFTDVLKELDALKSVEPLHIEKGEVLELWNVNKLLADAGEAFKELGSVKEKVRALLVEVERWHDQEYDLALLEAGLDRDSYPDTELRKAHARNEARELDGMVRAAKLALASVHDERSRLWAFREDLHNIGHNVRKEIGQ
jgi:hypothetical protein